MQIRSIHYKIAGSYRIANWLTTQLAIMKTITEKARLKARILQFWHKHGIEATMDAFGIPRRTLYHWKKQHTQSGGTIHALNDKREFNNSACCDALDNKDLTITLTQWIIAPYEANERGCRVLPRQFPQTD